jgi:hypothetical protein
MGVIHIRQHPVVTAQFINSPKIDLFFISSFLSIGWSSVGCEGYGARVCQRHMREHPPLRPQSKGCNLRYDTP